MTEAAILHWASLTHSGSRKPRNDDSLIANVATTRAINDAGAMRLEEVALQRFGAQRQTVSLQTYDASAVAVRGAGPLVAVDGGAVAVVARDDLSVFAKRYAFQGEDGSGGALDLDASPNTMADVTMLESNGYVYVVHYHLGDTKIYVEILAPDCP